MISSSMLSCQIEEIERNIIRQQVGTLLTRVFVVGVAVQGGGVDEGSGRAEAC